MSKLKTIFFLRFVLTYYTIIPTEQNDISKSLFFIRPSAESTKEERSKKKLTASTSWYRSEDIEEKDAEVERMK